ncbi:MAG: PAS domain S-box protein [Bacteroidota bacterium]
MKDQSENFPTTPSLPLKKWDGLKIDLSEQYPDANALLENIDEGLIIADPIGHIIFSNNRVEDLTGFHKEELVGTLIDQKLLSGADLAEETKKELIGIEHGKRELTFENKHKKGIAWWTSLKASPFKSPEGKYLGVIYILDDVGHYKQAEKVVQENDAKMRAIIDSALDAVIVINQEGKITEWNSQAEQIFGWSADEVKGVTISDTIIPRQYKSSHDKGFEHFLKTGEGPALNQRLEIKAVNRLDREFPIELTIIPIQLGEEYFFSAFIRDISQRKAQEEKREKLLNQLAQANAELKDFAYIVSHDLKAPLRAISSLSQWISEDYEEQFDEEGKQQFALLRGRVNRMSELITGILNYSKIGRVNTEIYHVNLQTLVEEIKEMLVIGEGIEITIPKELPTVSYNKVSAQQIFQNLMSNAIKYNDKETCKIEVGFTHGSHHHTFWVKDNGPGIDEKYHDKIFKIFQTLRPRDEVEATGVGLSIVKKTLNLFGGNIWIESELDTGTSFLFTIPHEPQLNLEI